MTLFIVLAVTGLPQKFFEASWARAVIMALGGIEQRPVGAPGRRPARSRSSPLRT